MNLGIEQNKKNLLDRGFSEVLDEWQHLLGHLEDYWLWLDDYKCVISFFDPFQVQIVLFLSFFLFFDFFYDNVFVISS